MTLCAMVLAFHQKPMAISGIEGNSINANPCASASAINSASQVECCRTPPVVRARPLVAQFFPHLPGPRRRLVIGMLWDATRCLIIGGASIQSLWRRLRLQFIKGLYLRVDFLERAFSSSPRDAGVGRGPRRGASLCNVSPPLLRPVPV